MKILLNGIVLVFGVLVFGAVSAAQDNRPQVGKISRLQGTVSASYQKSFRELRQDAPVFFEDELHTGPESRLVVTLEDGSELTLGPVSRLSIDEYVYTPQGDSSSMKINLLNGMLRFVGGKLENQPNARATIDTPVATLGIRGTEVITETQKHSVWVREGKVDATSKLTGEKVSLEEDESTIFTGGPCLIMILPKAEKKRRLDYLSFSN